MTSPSRISLLRRFALVAVVLVIVGSIAVVAIVRRVGLAADRKPSRMESFVAGRLVQLSIPSALASAGSPLAGDPNAWRTGTEVFRGNCASCHAADGRGGSVIGPNMYPPVPDLASPAVQRFSDGELFAIIRHGVSWTGMPAFRSVLADDEIWKFVAYVRQVPHLTAADIEPQSSPVPGGKDADVVMDGTTFTPGELTVSVGQSVSWFNNDPFPHNVESRTGAFRSGDLPASARWQYRPTERGVFEYVCTLHPGMKGVLRVR